MDSEHKHELQQNDLEHFLSNFGEWWSKNGTKLLAVVFGVAAVFMVVRVVRTNAHNAWQEQLKTLAEASDPYSYDNAAEAVSDPGLKAIALLRSADLRLAMSRKPTEGDNPKKLLDEAEAAYGKVAGMSGVHAVHALNAKLGLASIAENRRDFDAAEKHYTEVIDQAGESFPAIAFRAKGRRGMLPRLRQPIVFGDGSTPPAAAVTPDRFPFPLQPNPAAEIDPLRGLRQPMPGPGAVTPDPADEDSPLKDKE